jgi:ABC-2 type transport system permease protein
MNLIATFLHEQYWLFRHKGAAILLFAAPLIYSLFYPLPYQFAVVEEVPLIVWNNDFSAESRSWIAKLDASPELRVVAQLAGEPNKAQWQQYGDAQAFVYFPPNSRDKLVHQQQVNVAYGAKADNFLVYSTASRAIGLVLADINENWSLQYLYLNDKNAVTAEQYAKPIDSSVVPLFNDHSSYMQYLVPAVFILIVQQVLMMSLGMQWSYRFELNRPIGNAFALWNAHLWIYTLHGLALILFFFRWALPQQGVEINIDNRLLLHTALPFIVASIGFGMVLTHLMRKQESAIVWLLPTSIPMLLLSGISWPSFAMNEGLQAAAIWLPSTWGINALIDAVFLHQMPDIMIGWRTALFWLSLSLWLRLTVTDDMTAAGDNAAETGPSTV